MKAETEKRGRGRPQKPAAERKRRNITIRMRDEFRADLQSIADRNQRSLSEEIEFRLEQSRLDDADAGGPELRSLLQLMSGAARLLKQRRGKSFLDDWETCAELQAAWIRIVHAAVRPAPGVQPPEWLTDERTELPAPPVHPEYPQGDEPGLLNVSDEARRTYELQWQEYERKAAEWDAAAKEERRALKERLARLRAPEDFGVEIATAVMAKQEKHQ